MSNFLATVNNKTYILDRNTNEVYSLTTEDSNFGRFVASVAHILHYGTEVYPAELVKALSPEIKIKASYSAELSKTRTQIIHRQVSELCAPHTIRFNRRKNTFTFKVTEVDRPVVMEILNSIYGEWQIA